jgi:ribosomal protein S21
MYMRLGRSIEVKNGNVADALNKLQYTLQRNRVISELKSAARHEKKGYKRRRLSSKRWRRRFAHEVLARLL